MLLNLIESVDVGVSTFYRIRLLCYNGIMFIKLKQSTDSIIYGCSSLKRSISFRIVFVYHCMLACMSAFIHSAVGIARDNSLRIHPCPPATDMALVSLSAHLPSPWLPHTQVGYL